MIIIALGSNVAGNWGEPPETLRRAIAGLECDGTKVAAVSHWYTSAPMGQVRQPAFLNLALILRTELSALDLRLRAKRLEHKAGRRSGVRWGPRPLDVDIIDFRGQVLGWPTRHGRRPTLVLPHPEAHRRGFVLQPIIDIAPRWRHPALGLRVGDILRRQPELKRGLNRKT